MLQMDTEELSLIEKEYGEKTIQLEYTVRLSLD